MKKIILVLCLFACACGNEDLVESATDKIVRMEKLFRICDNNGGVASYSEYKSLGKTVYNNPTIKCMNGLSVSLSDMK